ncbi:hypothetical protein GA0111570_102116 [Raineyella antarctica]|uniref:DUF7691 domain-containing protein n=1 Tax=Raineyella antarctica TaxID=1577474 RepID=A0A1G6GE95_9ACTN|nr:hypothetical protein [Raineyella antarctica]SDB80328.1 hypothetical protein GA0111570_102116 [Raineyella antarctica]
MAQPARVGEPLGAGSSGGELRLYALGIDEVRDLFGAPEQRRAELRTLAHRALGLEPPPQRTRLWAALFRNDPHRPTTTDPDQPSNEDVEAMLAGRYAPPERNAARWRLTETLVSALAHDRLRVAADPALVEATDFALACLGAPAALGIRTLVDTPAMLPLPPLPGVRIGYVRGAMAEAMAQTYATHAPQLKEPAPRALVAELAAWLAHYPEWAARAAHGGRPAPDLLTFAFA